MPSALWARAQTQLQLPLLGNGSPCSLVERLKTSFCQSTSLQGDQKKASGSWNRPPRLATRRRHPKLNLFD
jgi:hypothetical protein